MIDYRNWSISLGRRFRALKIWFVMRSYGLNGMKTHIRRTIGLGNMFADLVRSRSDLFSIITKPAFALTVFRIKHPKTCTNGVTVAKADEGSNVLTKEVYELINSRGEIFLTSTVVAGVYAIRMVSANPNANETNVRRAFDIIVQTAEEVLQRE